MSDVSSLAHLAAAAAAVGAGAVNALAGGGTLISFPVLTAIGVPSVNANATNTVALCPGYVGGTWALRREIDATGEPLRTRLIVAGVGGLRRRAPAAVHEQRRVPLDRPVPDPAVVPPAGRPGPAAEVGDAAIAAPAGSPILELGGTFLAGVYGGYFGAGLGIMLIAVLGLFSAVPFTQLNAVKQPLAAAINLSAAAFLVFSGKIEWTLVAVMAPASLLGGALGGRLSTYLPANRFKWAVITFGVVISFIYLVR